MLIFGFTGYKIFSPIYFQNHIIIDYGLHPFDICIEQPVLWKYLKILFLITYIYSGIFFSNLLSNLFHLKNKSKTNKKIKLNKNNYSLINSNKKNELKLLVGENVNTKEIICLPEKSLYQNILITGTIGTGKTSSAMYPFTKQLIKYENYNNDRKLGMLILDVKGNYYRKVVEFANEFNRQDDIIVIELNGKYKYNPLHKPNLKPSILANRLKTILLLFSKNNSESYWLDKSAQVLEECIKLCRLYNNNYVTFDELHKLITNDNYYLEKINYLRDKFIKNIFSESQIYDLYSSLNFFEKEYLNLDQRTMSILKSEITRITNCFISDYDVLNTFNPKQEELNFFRF